MAVATVLYVSGVRRGWSRAGFGRGVTIGQTVAFTGGMIALTVSLVWPLDAFGDSLFAGHMVQHIVLMGVAAPLFVYGAPLPTMIRSLPRPLQRFSALIIRQRGWRAAWRWLSSPLFATVLQQIVLWFWHIPSAIAASLTSDAVHALMHSSLLGAGLLFWSAIARHGDRDLWPVAALLASGKLFLLFGALLAFSNTAFYSAYGDRPQSWGYSLLEDQQLAGVLMMVPGAMMFLLLPLIYIALWLVRLNRSQEQMTGSRRKARGESWVADLEGERAAWREPGLCLAAGTLHERLEGEQRPLADMVLDAFGVLLGRGLVEAEGPQESDDEAVALAAEFRQRLSFVGQEDRAVGLAGHEALPLQPGKVLRYGRHLDSETLRDVDGPGLSGPFD